MMGDLGKSVGKAPFSMSMPALDLAKGLPGLPPPGADPKAAALAAMGKLGGLPGLSMSSPSLGSPGTSKAPGIPDLGPLSKGIPGMPSMADLAKTMGLPPPGADPKAAAMAMLGKMGGMPGGMAPQSKVGMPDLGPPPSKAQMPPGGGTPPPSALMG